MSADGLHTLHDGLAVVVPRGHARLPEDTLGVGAHLHVHKGEWHTRFVSVTVHTPRQPQALFV